MKKHISYCSILRGQGSKAHSSIVSVSPSQSFPPNCGFGLVHVRVLFSVPFFPTPHVSPLFVLQAPLVQSLNFPSTRKTKNNRSNKNTNIIEEFYKSKKIYLIETGKMRILGHGLLTQSS